MPFGETVGGEEPHSPGLVVDDRLHRGFMFTTGQFLVYDLQRMELAARVPVPGVNEVKIAAADPEHHRIFWALEPQVFTTGCEVSKIGILDTEALTWELLSVPCLSQAGSTGESVVVTGMSYDSASNKLYLVAMPTSAYLVYQFSQPLPWQPTLFLEVDPTTLAISWSADVSHLCNWHQSITVAGNTAGTVSRAGDRLVGYCFQGGNSQNARGGRGAVITVPLHDGRPRVDRFGRVEAKVSTTYTDGEVLRVVDPVTGRILLISRNLPFGPAVWVYDSEHHWFNGTVPTGVDPNSNEGFDYVLDRSTGRLYLHSTRGVTLVDARNTPLPGGVSYKVDTDPTAVPGRALPMAVDGGLRRIFRPDIERKGWIVVDDRVPLLPDPPTPDPDRGTADIPEEEGKTERTFAGGGTAFGMHILNVGGLPAMVHGYNSRTDCAGRSLNRGSPCALDAAISPGNRQFFLGESAAAVGENSGAAAFATPGRSAPSDYATDADVRSLGRCFADRAEKFHASAREAFEDACPAVEAVVDSAATGPLDGFTFERMRGGTAPRASAEENFPLPGSGCTDFGDSAADPPRRHSPAPFDGLWSDVRCDADEIVALSSGHAAAFSAPAVSGTPSVTVARASSSVATRLDPEKGVVTTTEAVAEGISIGEVVWIGRAQTVATTAAFGRSGTTQAALVRTLSDVRAGDFRCAASCDPAAVADAITTAFSGLVQARVPEAEVLRSPRGYTGLVGKDPRRAASDAAINEDDTFTANALDLIFIQDYSRGAGSDGQLNAGRSRLVVSLAGVQAESHYGIFPRPQAGDGSISFEPVGEEVGTGGMPSDPGPYSVAPGPAPLTPPARIEVPPAGATRFPKSVSEAVRLIVNNPAQAALLAFFLAILAAPVYFAVRRRAVASVWQQV